MPALQRALESGDLSRTHARIIIDESAELRRLGIDRARINALTERAIAYSELHTPAQLARHMRSEIVNVAPMEAEIVHAAARGTRRVICYPEPDGMATILALLPVEAAQRVMNAINRIVRAQDDERKASKSAPREKSARSASPSSAEIQQFMRHTDLLETRRADAFIFLIEESALRFTQSPDIEGGLVSRSATTLAQGSENGAQINVTIDLPSLLGLADTPGELRGYGAIPASVARALAMSGKWRRFITDPTNGHLIDV
jgi:hypothetical protein